MKRRATVVLRTRGVFQWPEHCYKQTSRHSKKWTAQAFSQTPACLYSRQRHAYIKWDNRPIQTTRALSNIQGLEAVNPQQSLWEVQSQSEICMRALTYFWYKNHQNSKVRLTRASTDTNLVWRFDQQFIIILVFHHNISTRRNILVLKQTQRK